MTFWLSLLFLGLSSCYYDNTEDLYPQQNTNSCDTTNVKYSTTVKPILDNYCVSCHSTTNNQGGVNIEGYTNVKVYVDNGNLLKSIQHDAGVSPMPKGQAKLDDCKINKIKAWIDQGAPNN